MEDLENIKEEITFIKCEEKNMLSTKVKVHLII